jgi:hypothetical protein
MMFQWKVSGGSPPPAFTPASLFAGGELGAVYDISTRTSVFSDTGGTVQAVVLDPVARVNDLSGRGNHVTQATLGNRPILARHPSGGLRNILVQTATMATQTRTVKAAQHTLSFRGTGTVTLTGASTAGPLVGTGPSNIVSLTFTPSAGSLILTVSGTVEIAQLELGASRTSYQDVLDANGLNVTESGQADVYYLHNDGAGDNLESSQSTQLVGPWEFWAKINMLVGGGIGDAIFGKSETPGSTSSGVSTEGIYQRSDVVRRIWGASRIGSGTSFIASAENSFNFNVPVTAKVIASTGPDNLVASTPLASGNTAPTFTGTPGNSAFRIGTSNAAARFNFYGGVAIDRNLTAGEATDLDAWMDALLNP